MLTSRLLVSMFTVLATSFAYAQNFPTRPIHFITAGIGGPTEYAARVIGTAISGPLGQPVVVDNKPGGVILGDTVAKSAPDGYTLLVTGGTLWTGPLVAPAPYDPVKDFAPITLVGTTPQMMVAHPSMPKTVKELIALAKSKPGELNYGSGSTGGLTHLMGELFNVMAGVKIVRIPYTSDAAETVDHIAGRVQLQYNAPSAVMEHVKAGKLVLLALTSAQPSPLYPGVPTVSEILPGYDAEGYTTIFAPAKTPDPIIRRLNAEIVRYLRTPDAAEKLVTIAAKPVASSPEELGAAVNSEIAKWGKLIKDLGIKAN